jgi:hypothetical protein
LVLLPLISFHTLDMRDLQGILDGVEDSEELELEAASAGDLDDRHRQCQNDILALEQRLRVYQTQFSEYASEKSTCDAELAAQLGTLGAMMGGLTSSDGLMATLSKVKEELEGSATEASLRAKMISEERLVLSSVGASGGKRGRDSTGGQVETAADGQDAEDGGEGDDPMAAGGVDDEAMEDGMDTSDEANGRLAADESMLERAKYIPLRLEHEERRILRLLEGALNVSEYTDKVDVLSYRSKSGRVVAQVKDLCAILCGLTVAQNFKKGKELIEQRDFQELQTFFQATFEVGRRYKVMNPDKMRDTYGKLMYMLMDSVEPEIQELLGFKCARPLCTVHSFLEERGADRLLRDPSISTAIAEITTEGKSRHQVQKDIKLKERTRDALARKYSNANCSSEDLLRCMYSLGDNNSYLRFNRDPVDNMLAYLDAFFRVDHVQEGYSLAICAGRGGARLTHNHARQFTFAKQTLMLWREVSNDMFKLWYMADADMLSDRNRYRLQNTGQGMQRVQSAGNVGRAMSAIIGRCQRRLGSWVGSSVVHLGDHNVPNALMFIDKYTQVPRILNPIVLVLEELPKITTKDRAILEYVNTVYGSVEDCQKCILADFFRHAFDGSGADNFIDAGSCIDGRLTSAWNWCSKIEKKEYYSVFRLCGFVSFDGDFR